jgi:hypothetical protein
VSFVDEATRFSLHSQGIIPMAHLVEQMAYVGTTPWHGLGSRLSPKQALEVWQREKPKEGNITAILAAQPEIQDECHRILQGLHRQEQEVAIRFARNQSYALDDPTLTHLQRRGLIGREGRRWSDRV